MPQHGVTAEVQLEQHVVAIERVAQAQVAFDQGHLRSIAEGHDMPRLRDARLVEPHGQVEQLDGLLDLHATRGQQHETIVEARGVQCGQDMGAVAGDRRQDLA